MSITVNFQDEALYLWVPAKMRAGAKRARLLLASVPAPSAAVALSPALSCLENRHLPMGAPFYSLPSPAIPQEGATETFLPPLLPLRWRGSLSSKTAPLTPSGPSGVRPRPLTHGPTWLPVVLCSLPGPGRALPSPWSRVPSFADLS